MFRDECLEPPDCDEREGSVSVPLADTSMSSLFSYASSQSTEDELFNSSHFEKITNAVKQTLDSNQYKISTTITSPALTEEDIEMIDTVLALVEDARSFWREEHRPLFSCRERQEALSEFHLELEYVAAVTDVHVDWLVRQTKKRKGLLPKEGEVDEGEEEGIKSCHDKIQLAPEYSIEQQIDDLPTSHFSWRTPAPSECGSDYRSPPNAPPHLNFPQAVCSMPSSEDRLASIAHKYLDLKENLSSDQDANDFYLWLDCICDEFDNFNRQFVRSILSLHQRNIENSIFALHELDISRQIRSMQLEGKKNSRGEGVTTGWFPPMPQNDTTANPKPKWNDDGRFSVYSSIASTISRLSHP